MKFNFPKDKKTDTVTISIYENDIKKIRALAELNKCTHQDIYKTLINEALEEYEERFGILTGKEAKPQYSVKRDFIEAGDNKRKEVLDGEEFDGGGDLRTKEEKKQQEEMYVYCPNPKCHRKFGKFVKATGHTRNEIEYCSIRCADISSPKTQPLPQNFGVIAYCNYLLCDTKKFNLEDGIEVDGKKFCSEKCYASWLESVKDLK